MGRKWAADAPVTFPLLAKRKYFLNDPCDPTFQGKLLFSKMSYPLRTGDSL